MNESLTAEEERPPRPGLLAGTRLAPVCPTLSLGAVRARSGRTECSAKECGRYRLLLMADNVL
jgi:hypothetical protein